MIRTYREDDFEALTYFWCQAMDVAMPGLEARMGHTLENAREFFRNVVLSENAVFVYESDAIPIGYLAIKSDFIDRLYVDPRHHRRGVGQALLSQAQGLSPEHLWLFTHVANKMARGFYEKNGFMATRFGMSPAPESEPDVEYHWWRHE